MAEAKKGTAKVIAKEAPEKEESKKSEVKAEAKEASKAAKPARKTPGRKPAAKKTAAKAAAEKKTTTTGKKPGRKPAVKEIVNFQFSGKSYTPGDLVKICKDVWKYDLNGKEEDFKTVELYVKPEENTVYYVINGDVTGSFLI